MYKKRIKPSQWEVFIDKCLAHTQLDQILTIQQRSPKNNQIPIKEIEKLNLRKNENIKNLRQAN